MVKVEDMGVTRQGKKKTQKKNPRKTTQNVKMSQGKKRPYKKVALTSAQKRKINRQSPQRIMMIKKERNLKAIKRANKGENLRQFAFCYSKLLENGLV